MKRILLALLVIALCIPCGALAGETMRIANCQDWVSLRSAPSTQAPRLMQVPLGAFVDCEPDYDSEFSLCSYEGVTGYILDEYLERVALYAQVGAFTVLGERNYINDREVMEIVCLDARGDKCWQRRWEFPALTGLSGTDAFVAGTAQEPMILTHVAGVGLTALDLYTGQERWTLGSDVVDLGGGLCCTVAEDGTIYIGGYYGPDPVAISADGELLWQSSPVYGEGDGQPLEFWWLYKLELRPDGLIATYDMGMDDQGRECSGELLYSLDGELLSYCYLYDMY